MQPLPTLSHTVDTQTFSINVPDEWVDSSVVAWAAKPSVNQPIAPNIIVQRQPMPEEPMGNFINDQMKELLITSSTMEIEHRADIQWHGLNATELHISWEHDGNHIRQRQLYIQQTPKDLLIIGFTSRDTDFESYLPFFNDIEQSFVAK